MKFEIEKTRCAGCGACLQACPYGAIKMGEDGKAVIDQSKCKKCGKCQEICPFDAIEKILEEGEGGNKKNIKQSESSTPVRTPDVSLVTGKRGFGMRRGLGRGFGKGLGKGPRNGKGRGRGGGGKMFHE